MRIIEIDLLRRFKINKMTVTTDDFFREFA